MLTTFFVYLALCKLLSEWTTEHMCINSLISVCNYDFRLPWNQNTLFGWFAEAVYSVFAVAATLCIATPFLTLLISFLIFHRAFNKMYRLQFKTIDSMTLETPGQRLAVKRLIFESVSFHISAKKYVNSADLKSKFRISNEKCIITNFNVYLLFQPFSRNGSCLWQLYSHICGEPYCFGCNRRISDGFGMWKW